jgi:hypothetical protein
MIVVNDAHVSYMLATARKAYLTMPTNSGGMGGRPSAPFDDTPSDFQLTKTGRTEVVAGVTCDIYHGSGTDRRTGKRQEGDARISDHAGFNPLAFADAMRNRRAASAAGQLPMFEQFRKIIGTNGGIMKVWQMENGKNSVAMEVTSVDTSVPSDAMFAPPSDYTKMDVPGMIGAPRRPD